MTSEKKTLRLLMRNGRVAIIQFITWERSSFIG